MKRYRIASLGEVLWDRFPQGERFGGAPANFACHAAVQGSEVIMLSAVGDDQRGTEALNTLNRFGIDTSQIQVLPHRPTGTVSVDLDPQGKPTFDIHEGVAWDCLAWHDQLATSIARADAVYFGTLGQRGNVSRNTIQRCLDIAIAQEIPRVLDVNLRSPFYDAALIRESIRRASILKLSDEELDEVCAACGMDTEGQPEKRLRDLLELGALHMVVMTRGPDGAVLITADNVYEQPGIHTHVVDTVGAGDAFIAAFVIGVLRGERHQDALHQACEVASKACAHPGAVPPIQSS